MSREIKQFEVSIKAVLERDGALLMMQNPKSKTWEFPGGRIDVGEEGLSAEDILQRELKEELGNQIKYEVIGPTATWIIPWKGNRLGEHVFAVGFQCIYQGGEIVISDEHSAYQWVTPESVKTLHLIEGYDHALDQIWKNR